MAGWLANWLGGQESSTVVTVSGKALEVRCSAAAGRALAGRASPLIVEMELAFACFARKEMRFHEVPGKLAVDGSLVPVNEKLALLVSTVIPDSCEAGVSSGRAARAPARNFVPRWVRIDYAKGRWGGEYGL